MFVVKLKHQSTKNVWATSDGGHVARVSPEPRVFTNNELPIREIQLVQCQRSSPKQCFKLALKWVSKDQTNLYNFLLKYFEFKIKKKTLHNKKDELGNISACVKKMTFYCLFTVNIDSFAP